VEGNVKLFGEMKGAETAGAVVPVSRTVAAGALLSIFRAPMKVPAEVGANFRFTVQVAPGAIVVAQLSVWEKLGSPDTEILLITNGLKPVLERVMGDVMVCPGEINPKVTEFTGSVSAGAVGAGTEPVTANMMIPTGRMV